MIIKNALLENLDKIHTTELGIERIKRNLSLNIDNVVEWYKEKIVSNEVSIIRKGKKWYITLENYIITVNGYSYTIITSHRVK